MPLEPTTPANKDVKITEEKSITHFHIVALNITIDPNDASLTEVTVRWKEGYMDSSTFVSAESHTENLTGSDVIDAINETTDGTTSVYDNVKQRVWALLQARELVPAGSIT